MLKAFLPRYTFTKVPDFLGTSLISRLPDSLDHGKQKSLLLRLFDHGFIGVITITPHSRFLLSSKIIQIWLSPSGDKLKKLWENGNLGGGLHPSLHPERSGLYLKQLTDHFLDTGGRPSSTVSIRNWERATSLLWNKGAFTTADAKMGYRANWAMLQYWRWSIWLISVSPLTL